MLLDADPGRAVEVANDGYAGLPEAMRVRLVRAARDARLSHSPLVRRARTDPSPWVRREAEALH